jgi:hypothetical protein
MKAQPYPSLVAPLWRLKAQMKDNTPDKHRQNDKKDNEHTPETDPTQPRHKQPGLLFQLVFQRVFCLVFIHVFILVFNLVFPLGAA